MGELIRLAKKTWKLSPGQREELVQGYLAGGRVGELALKYEIDPNSVRRILRSRGIERPAQNNLLPVDELAFSVLDDDTAYWLGFLMADGCITGGQLQVHLASVDRGHLCKLKAFLKADHAITDVPAQTWKRRGKVVHNGPSCRFAIGNKRVLGDLARWGIVPRKSLTAKAPKELAHNRHFWRGVVDGDGCLGSYQNRNAKMRSVTFLSRVGIVGSKPLLRQFKRFVEGTFGERDSSVRPSASIFQIDYNGKFADELIRHLYGGDVVALDRKARMAARILRTGR